MKTLGIALLGGLLACSSGSSQKVATPEAGQTSAKAYGRSEVNQQLKAIQIPIIHFREASLNDVLKTIEAQAVQSDFPLNAVNFLAPDLAGIAVTIDPPRKGLSLAEALDAVIKGASEPIRYSTENFGIVFRRYEPIMPALYTRWFKLNGAALEVKLPALQRADPDRQTAVLKEFLARQGLGFAPPRQIFYNPRLGQLMIRARLDELDKVEELLNDFRLAAEQIAFALQFAEVPAPASPLMMPNLSVDAALPQALPEYQFKVSSNSMTGVFTYSQARFSGMATNRSHSSNHVAVVGTLTAPQYDAVIEQFKRRTGVDLLAPPKRLANDGQPTLFHLAGAAPISPDAKLSLDETSTPVGPSVIVSPALAEDKRSLLLSVTAAVKEFMGYDLESSAMAGSGRVDPVGVYRLRQITTELDLKLGETVVLGIGPVPSAERTTDRVPVLGDLPIVGRLFRSETKTSAPKHLWFFITPILP